MGVFPVLLNTVFLSFQLTLNLLLIIVISNYLKESVKVSESTEKNTSKETIEEKDNIIIEIFKKLLEINFTIYGGKKDVLK